MFGAEFLDLVFLVPDPGWETIRAFSSVVYFRVVADEVLLQGFLDALQLPLERLKFLFEVFILFLQILVRPLAEAESADVLHDTFSYEGLFVIRTRFLRFPRETYIGVSVRKYQIFKGFLSLYMFLLLVSVCGCVVANRTRSDYAV